MSFKNSKIIIDLVLESSINKNIIRNLSRYLVINLNNNEVNDIRFNNLRD